MNSKIIKSIFPKMYDKIQKGKCPICDECINIEDFKDEISLKEFNISGLCQKCQDSFFK